MKTIQLFFCVLLATLLPRFASADLVGPYTADANTLFLLHFDEPAATSVATNYGTKGGKFYSVSEAVASATPPPVTTMLGAAAYVNGPTNFNSCMTNPTVGYLFGYDANNSGAYQGEGTAPCPDAIAMTNLNIGNGGQSAFTIEALIRPTTISANEEIVCTDSSSGTGRAFQFRISNGSLQFSYITGSGLAVSGTIPTTGNDAFVSNNWYHVAVVYNGSTATLYWTLLNPTNGAAHILSSASLAIGATQGAFTGPLCIGNENRAAATTETFLGSIDEVRISSVARAANQMQFFSPLVTITANPVSQNVDYNQPVTFSVGAASLTALSYQWRFNSNSVPGLTNSTFTITNVAANNAGYYDVIVTNTAGYSATGLPALLVVGAANFLANRYSFTSDTTDSIGGKTGTNIGNAIVTGGKLVLDGTTDTYMQLPPNLFNAANATALTVEFWATYGSNPNNVYTFAFGVTNFVFSQGIVGFSYAIYSPHNAAGQTASSSPGDPIFAQSLNAAGNLDGKTVHVAVVFDPPNKLLSIYTNGVLEAVNTNFTVNISSLNDQFSFIGRSLWAADPFLNASIDELRIFKGALSPITIKQSDDQGPNTLLADGPGKFTVLPANISVPVGQTATFTAAAVGYLPIVYQWFKNGNLVPNATNAAYSFTALIGDNGSTFSVHATNVIGVTTYVTNSASATLTVFVPPTLAWLDAANGGADSFWNTTSLNWTNPGVLGVLAFSQTNGVLFDSRGSGSPNVDITEAVIPYNITVNASTDYTLTSSGANGSLNGQGGISKVNSGRLIIDVTNNLSGPVVISGGTLQVGNGDSSGSLGSGVITNNSILSLNRADAALNIGNVIHGSGILSLDGTGLVVVSGDNDYTGSTLVNSGVLSLQSASGLGSTGSGTVISSGGQLYLTANVNLAENLTLNGAGDGNGALRKGAAGLTVQNGTISLASDSTIGMDGGATLVLSNVVSGAAVLTATGTGTLAFNANNSFNGGFMLNGPVIGVNATGALGTGPVNVTGAGRFVIATGLTMTNAVTANIPSPGAATGLLMVNDNTNNTVTTVSGLLSFGGAPVNGGNFVGPATSGYLNIAGFVSAPGFVTSVRSGNVRFSGGGDYAELQVQAGTSSLGMNNALATNAVLDLAGNGSPVNPTTLDLNGFNQQLAGLKNTLAPANLGMVTNGGATVKTLLLDLGAGNVLSFSGIVAGKVALTLNSGTQILTGTNSYTGNTTVNGGTLELAAASLFSGSTVTVTNSATLQLDFSVTNNIAGLVLGGVTQPTGVYNASTSPAFITGSGSLQVTPSVNTTPTNIVATVSGGNLILTWPADHIGWRLQAQTNSLANGLGTNWVDVPNTSGVNAVTNVINPASGAVFYRLVY